MALERFAGEKDLTGLAYYYEAEPGSEMRELVTNFAVGNSLLIAAGFPMCGEFDLKTCLGMLIMDRLEIGGSLPNSTRSISSAARCWWGTMGRTISTSPPRNRSCAVWTFSTASPVPGPGWNSRSRKAH